jgi:S-adenosylmethionine hydrolase
MSRPTITLLTDFGLRDGYVAAVKGVLLSRCPEARLVDVSHEIRPGAIATAAFVLGQAAPYFPAGTVHLAVVDPGVGSARRAIACEVGDQRFVAPDNGLLSRVLDAGPLRVHELREPELWRDEVSAVFHGRDLFGPVAAHLAAGGALERVGPPVDAATLVRLAWPEPTARDRELVARIVHVDRFGNLVTSLRLEGEASPACVVELAGRTIPVRRTYADVASGELLALRGSSGLLEVAANCASAAELLGVGPGDVVTWRRPAQD